MVPIADMSGYNSLMKKGLLDKTFFLRHTNANVIFDYGCADGSMIEFIAKIFPEYKFYGYDNDQKMIDLANKKNIKNAIFDCNFDDLIRTMNLTKKSEDKTILVLSSVIHEIYSYLDQDEIDDFWTKSLNSEFDFIAIRDMMNFNHPEDLDTSVARKIRKYADSDQLAEFVKIYGNINKIKNQIHFLLKYKYVDNWKRELVEDYFSWEYGNFVEMIMFNEIYEQTYYKEFNLPHMKKQVEDEFKFVFEHNTHIKLILEKRNG